MNEWRLEAACRSEDPEIFFPVYTYGHPELVLKAKAICNRCPVRSDCLAFARSTRQEQGIWGGLTADERRALR